MKKRIMVTGMGVVTSIGIGKDTFWDNLIQGKSGISKIEAFDTSKHFTHYGGEVKDFRPEDFIDKREIKLMARASHLGIAATNLALKDARINWEKFAANNIAVCIGTTSGEIPEMESIDSSWVKEGYDKINKRSIALYPENNIPSNIALEFKLNGPNLLFTSACAAGNYAIGYGYDLLLTDKTELAIAGGVEAISYISFTGFNQLGATAPLKCQPFDKNRKGMLLGEGAGIVVLETLESALKRGVHIYGEILGYGLSCDAYHMTNPDPTGIAQCIQNALYESGLTPFDVDYICAHGTGTPRNDKAECAAIKMIFGDKKIPVSSIKSMIGHTMGAASAIEAITCCLSVKNDAIPPTINYETPDPDCNIDCVPNTSRKQKVNIALNNGFAFGGNNSCLVIKKYEGRKDYAERRN